jgi:hypothetical protein
VENENSLAPYLSHSALGITQIGDGYSILIYFDTSNELYRTSYVEDIDHTILETQYLEAPEVISFISEHFN